MKKKLLLSSVAALTLFAAYNTASADYVRNDPGIRTGVQPANNSNGKVKDKNNNDLKIVDQVDAEVKVDDEGVTRVAAKIVEHEDGTVTIERSTTPVSGRTVGSQRLVLYSDGSSSSTFYSNDKGNKDADGNPLPMATNPYDSQFNLDKDGNVVKPIRYGNGTHVRVTVKDYQGNPVAGVKVAALVYATVEDFDNHAKPALVEKVTDGAGDIEFPVKNGGYVVYRVDEAPKGYHVPNKLVNGTLLDAEEVVRQDGNMFVNGTLYVEKTDTYNVAKEEWVLEEAGWKYYANNKAATGWKQIEGKWYFFNAEGVSQKWWVQDNGTWYYLNGAGEMQTGWLQDNGTWYYLEASGALKVNQWFEVGGKWYHVDASGALSVNTTVDGYNVNENGEWV